MPSSSDIPILHTELMDDLEQMPTLNLHLS